MKKLIFILALIGSSVIAQQLPYNPTPVTIAGLGASGLYYNYAADPGTGALLTGTGFGFAVPQVPQPQQTVALAGACNSGHSCLVAVDPATGAILTSGSGGGAGTVTSVGATGTAIVDVTVTNPTTTPLIILTLPNQAANCALGNFTGSPAAPSCSSTPQFNGANITGINFTQIGGTASIAQLPATVIQTVGTATANVILKRTTSNTATDSSLTDNGTTITTTESITAPSFIGTATTATNLPGGLLGSMPYQSAPGTTAMLAGSTSSAIAVLTQTGTGSLSTAPNWNAATGTGLAAFGTAPTLTNPVITGGSINNTPIGATTRSTGQFTTVNCTSTCVGSNIMAGEGVVAFSATPAFSSGTVQSQIMILTANVTSWTMAAGVAGRGFTLTLCQNATGGFTVAGTPANVRGFGTIGTTLSTCSSQHFTYSGSQTAWLADSAMVINM